MTYEETIAWLYSLEGRLGMDFRLERLTPVLAALGDPHLAFDSILIAGTNGKGSTAAMVDAVLRRAGRTTGLYTSPHLVRFTERIQISGREISESDVVRYAREIARAAEQSSVELTYFEITTIMAFCAFRDAGVALAVVEVGLGGRLDATNVVRPVVTAITSIGLDHCAFLGDTIAEIAAEKAGIARAGVPLVTGPLEPDAASVVAAAAEEVGAPLVRCTAGEGAERDAAGPALAGEHQRRNAAVARAVLEALASSERAASREGTAGGNAAPIDADDIAAGLAEVSWPGRFERIEVPAAAAGRAGRVEIVLDGGHNPAAAEALAAAIESHCDARPRVLVFGVMADKDWRAMLDALIPAVDRIVPVPVDVPRSLAVDEIAAYLRQVAQVEVAGVADSAASGFNEALLEVLSGGTVIVAGSIFLIGELRGAALAAGDAQGKTPD